MVLDIPYRWTCMKSASIFTCNMYIYIDCSIINRVGNDSDKIFALDIVITFSSYSHNHPPSSAGCTIPEPFHPPNNRVRTNHSTHVRARIFRRRQHRRQQTLTNQHTHKLALRHRIVQSSAHLHYHHHHYRQHHHLHWQQHREHRSSSSSAIPSTVRQYLVASSRRRRRRPRRCCCRKWHTIRHTLWNTNTTAHSGTHWLHQESMFWWWRNVGSEINPNAYLGRKSDRDDGGSGSGGDDAIIYKNYVLHSQKQIVCASL